MTLGLVILLAAVGLLFLQVRSEANQSASRMTRFVPSFALEQDAAAGGAGSLAGGLARILRVLDPGFAKLEPMLRLLGVASAETMLTIQMARIGGAVFTGILAVELVSLLTPAPLYRTTVPLLVFLVFIWLVNKLIRMACLNRRRLIRKEMTLGLEIFCIFLEGGQSLDQSFRSFGEICGQALPHLASIQRALVTDIDNGVSYEKAIGRWADNLGIDEAKAIAVLFIDSLVHGTELVPHLRQFSGELVEQRISGARASIGVKSSQLTVVMVLFFLPAILVFLTAPAITALVNVLGIR